MIEHRMFYNQSQNDASDIFMLQTKPLCEYAGEKMTAKLYM